MTASRATSTDGKPGFAALQMLRVEPEYRALLTNEKMAAREEFLRAFDRGAERVRTSCYALAGVADGAELLVLRSSAHLEDLHAAAALLGDAGLGRHLTPVALYLGTVAAMHAPTGRLLTAVPLATPPKLGAPAGARLTLLDGRGLGSAPCVALLEGDDPLMGRKLLEAEGVAPVGPVRLGLHGEIRDIVDSL